MRRYYLIIQLNLCLILGVVTSVNAADLSIYLIADSAMVDPQLKKLRQLADSLDFVRLTTLEKNTDPDAFYVRQDKGALTVYRLNTVTVVRRFGSFSVANFRLFLQQHHWLNQMDDLEQKGMFSTNVELAGVAERGSLTVGEQFGIGINTDKVAQQWLVAVDSLGWATILYPSKQAEVEPLPIGYSELFYGIKVTEPSGEDWLFSLAFTSAPARLQAYIGQSFHVTSTQGTAFKNIITANRNRLAKHTIRMQIFNPLDEKNAERSGVLYALKSEQYIKNNDLCNASNALVSAAKLAADHAIVQRVSMAWEYSRTQQVVNTKTIDCLLNIARSAFNRGMNLVPSFNLSVPYETDRADISPLGVLQLDQLAAALSNSRYDKFQFILVGHADKRGDVVHNQVLSQRRANAAMRYLQQKRPNLQRRLSAIGKGESQLKMAGDSDRAHEVNRRVEVQLRLAD